MGWNRRLIRKGRREVESGIVCVDAFELCGRRLSESRLPNLFADIKSLVNSQSQTDPKFKTSRLYTHLSAAEVRRQLIRQSGYSSEELPREETIRTRLNQLGYYPKPLDEIIYT